MSKEMIKDYIRAEFRDHFDLTLTQVRSNRKARAFYFYILQKYEFTQEQIAKYFWCSQQLVSKCIIEARQRVESDKRLRFKIRAIEWCINQRKEAA